MTGNKKYLSDYIESRKGSVNFGEREKNKVVGIGIVNVEGMPKLKNVLHIERMKTNLINISQLCDKDLLVFFDKRRFYVITEDEEYIITGTKTLDNCYQMNVVVESNNMTIQIYDVEL